MQIKASAFGGTLPELKDSVAQVRKWLDENYGISLSSSDTHHMLAELDYPQFVEIGPCYTWMDKARVITDEDRERWADPKRRVSLYALCHVLGLPRTENNCKDAAQLALRIYNKSVRMVTLNPTSLSSLVLTDAGMAWERRNTRSELSEARQMTAAGIDLTAGAGQDNRIGMGMVQRAAGELVAGAKPNPRVLDAVFKRWEVDALAYRLEAYQGFVVFVVVEAGRSCVKTVATTHAANPSHVDGYTLCAQLLWKAWTLQQEWRAKEKHMFVPATVLYDAVKDLVPDEVVFKGSYPEFKLNGARKPALPAFNAPGYAEYIRAKEAPQEAVRVAAKRSAPINPNVREEIVRELVCAGLTELCMVSHGADGTPPPKVLCGGGTTATHAFEFHMEDLNMATPEGRAAVGAWLKQSNLAPVVLSFQEHAGLQPGQVPRVRALAGDYPRMKVILTVPMGAT